MWDIPVAVNTADWEVLSFSAGRAMSAKPAKTRLCVKSEMKLLSIYIYTHIQIYIYTHTYIHTYTHTGHFIRYTLLVPGWTPFCFQNCLSSSWHRFNKVLETFLRDFGPYWHDSITQLLQICRLHIHDANLPFHYIPKVLYWIEIWWLWRSFE